MKPSSLRVGLAQINPTVGAFESNLQKIFLSLERASEAGCRLLVFPEMALSGYPAEDLWLRNDYLQACAEAEQHLIKNIPSNLHVLIGAPELIPEALAAHDMPSQPRSYNAALWLTRKTKLGVVAKQSLPNYGMFDESRYFQKGTSTQIIDIEGYRLAVFICEDLWALPLPNERLDGIIHVNASPYFFKKPALRRKHLMDKLSSFQGGFFHVNLVGGQDDWVFDGHSWISDGSSGIVAEAHFRETLLLADLKKNEGHTFLESPHKLFLDASDPGESSEALAELECALVLALRDYVSKNRIRGVVIGLSGGIDSALSLVLAVKALGTSRVEAWMLPSEYTHPMSLEDAQTLATTLGVSYGTLPIDSLRLEAERLLSEAGVPPSGVTQENIQARIRCQLLMAVANQKAYILLNTSNKSELAVGYSTLYGDLAGGFSPLGDLLKTQVYELAAFQNRTQTVIPERMLSRAPSAELRHDQHDQQSLPPYELLDHALECIFQGGGAAELEAEGIPPPEIDRIFSLLFQAQFKRSQAPLAPRVSPVSLKRMWRFPISQRFKASETSPLAHQED